MTVPRMHVKRDPIEFKGSRTFLVESYISQGSCFKIYLTLPKTPHIGELRHLDLYVVGSEQKTSLLKQTPITLSLSGFLEQNASAGEDCVLLPLANRPCGFRGSGSTDPNR